MGIKKVVFTGDAAFLYRYQFLLNAMSLYFENVERIPSGNLYESKSLKTVMKFLRGITALLFPSRASIFRKKTQGFITNAQGFITRSQQIERKIRKLRYTPDMVFHVFSLYCPFWDKFDIPYAMYLDYTMALAERNWSAWAAFANHQEFAAWVDCERMAYKQAYHLFPMSNLVKSSLIEDYGIKPEKITVVGSSGNFQEPYEGEKTFGSKQILFNGSDFERKGGDLVLAAFKQVKKALPEAKLVIIGKKLTIREDGVENPGRISSLTEMRNLFLKTDLVVAPSRCEPFQEFLLEAMNYGVPCIVSASDGMPEIIDNGVNGIVIAQPTPELLANQIINLLCDLTALTSMSQNVRHKVKTKFNWNDIAKNISQALSTSLF